MKIKMTENQRGSNNGINIELYKESCEYDVSEDLGNVFTKQLNCAIEVKGKATEKKAEVKMEKVKAEVKMEPKAPQNKSIFSRKK